MSDISGRPRYRAPYLDTSVYIEAIKGTASECPERPPVAREILTRAELDEIGVVASTFVLVEVLRDRGQEVDTRPDALETIDAYFQRSAIKWAELDRRIACLARDIAREESLRPADAVHVATAIDLDADVFLAWDDRLVRGGRRIRGLEVREPYLWGQSELGLGLGV